MYTISIVTIVRNDLLGIDKTISSVLEQTYDDVEYIIKDGKSTDGTSDKIQVLLKQYDGKKSIRYINSADSSIYNAMNQAIEIASGKWILFLNSGDYFAENRVLEKIYTSRMLVENYGMICGSAITAYNGQLGLWKADISDLSQKFPCCHQSCIMQTKFVKQHKFDERYAISADFNMVLDFWCSKSDDIYVYDGIISFYSLDGISANKFILRAKEYFMIRSQHGFSDGVITRVNKRLLALVKEAMCYAFPQDALNVIKRLYAKRKYGNVNKDDINKLYGIEFVER